MRTSRILPLLVFPFILGCASAPTLHAVRTEGEDPIPTAIVIYPLLSTEVAGARYRGPVLFNQNRDNMYIEPPAESSLKVTSQSERLTGLLSAELLQRGFKLRDLPVETPVEEKSTFAVSLALLDDLRANNGVEAILIGNAFFKRDYYDPTDAHVTDFYVKVVDVRTLEVMCQVVLPHDSNGWVMDGVAREVADCLAAEANLPVKERL